MTLRAATGVFFTVLFLAGGAIAASKPEYVLRNTYGEFGRGRNEMISPSGLAISSRGILAVSDGKRNAVMLFDEDGHWIRSIGVETSGTGRFFDYPKGLCFDRRDRIWVADSKNDRLVTLEEDGSILGTVGERGFGKGDLHAPGSVTSSGTGRIYVADTGNRRVEVFSNRGEYLDKWEPGNVSLKGHLSRPAFIAFSPVGDGFIWVVESGSSVISRFDLEGNWKASVDVEKAAGRKVSLAGIAVDSRFGWVFLLDESSSSVLILNGDGEMQAEVGAEVGVRPVAIAVNGHRDIFLADSAKARVLYYERK